MRPKKLILVLDPNPDTLGVTMFSLSIRGFKTVGAHTISQALMIAQEQKLDAVLTLVPIVETWNLPVPVVFKDKMDMAAAVEALKMRSASKRGPRKGWKLRDIHPQVCS